MTLEVIVLSEMSQSQKDRYFLLHVESRF
jgi:hypothetical protein